METMDTITNAGARTHNLLKCGPRHPRDKIVVDKWLIQAQVKSRSAFDTRLPKGNKRGYVESSLNTLASFLSMMEKPDIDAHLKGHRRRSANEQKSTSQ